MIAWLGFALLATVIAYGLGSIPSGYWLGLRHGIDIRAQGSGGTGATNVLRTLGKAPAATVLAIDLLKGVAAVAFAGWLLSLPMVAALAPAGVAPETSRSWAMALAALFAVIGHSRSIWIGFTGGKSAATGLGVLLALSWPVGLGVAITFAVAVLLSHRVSLGSIVAAGAAVVLMAGLRQPPAFLALALVGSAYVIWCHRSNLARLAAGIEPRIGQ